MGWTSISASDVGRTANEINQFLIKEMERGGHLKVLDVSKKGNVVYMAVRQIKLGNIFAAVIPYSFDKGEFFWKEMDDSCGPVQKDCPKRILNQLTPTDSEFANQWRKECLANLTKPKTKYKYGDIIEFANEVTFTDGHKGTSFILLKRGNAYRFTPYTGQPEIHGYAYPLYRITSWRKAEHTVKGNIAKEE